VPKCASQVGCRTSNARQVAETSDQKNKPDTGDLPCEVQILAAVQSSFDYRVSEFETMVTREVAGALFHQPVVKLPNRGLH
jgi:hypothetical protein